MQKNLSEILGDLSQILSKLKECDIAKMPGKDQIIINQIIDKIHSILDDKDDEKILPEHITLMVIDDDPILQQILKRKLESKGLTVFSYTNPEEALSNIVANNPDVIVLDLIMPEMSGFEFMQKIRQIDPQGNIGIIAGSGRQHRRDRLSTLESGASDFIDKPYDPDELYLRIMKMVK